jgi:hypothetical protein
MRKKVKILCENFIFFIIKVYFILEKIIFFRNIYQKKDNLF